MIPSDAPFAHEAQVVRRLCHQAARAALDIAQRPLHVMYKDGDDRSPVTEADRAANDILVEGLGQHFPGDGICAEESSDTHAYGPRAHKSRLWCIDPIDGTREFIAGTGQWAVMVGLAIDGAARFGAVYEPADGSLFMGATDGHGAAWAVVSQGDTHSPMRVSNQKTPAYSRLMVSRHQRNRTLDALCATMCITKRTPLGSVGLKMARLSRADADLYACVTDKIHEWDACGPAAILEGAGGTVTDLAGRPLTFNKPDTHMRHGLLASNGPLHQPALTALEHAARELPHLARLRGESAGSA